MTQWTHLFPSRTEKLSTVVAKVAQARIARRWALFLYIYYIFQYIPRFSTLLFYFLALIIYGIILKLLREFLWQTTKKRILVLHLMLRK